MKIYGTVDLDPFSLQVLIRQPWRLLWEWLIYIANSLMHPGGKRFDFVEIIVRLWSSPSITVIDDGFSQTFVKMNIGCVAAIQYQKLACFLLHFS